MQSARTVQIGVHLLESKQGLLFTFDLRDEQLLQLVLEAYLLAAQHFLELHVLIREELGLKTADFSQEEEECLQGELITSCHVAISDPQKILEALDKFFNGFLPNIIGIYSGEEVISNKEEEKDEISRDTLKIVFDLHLVFEFGVLQIEAFPEDRKVDKFEVHFFLLAGTHDLYLI